MSSIATYESNRRLFDVEFVGNSWRLNGPALVCTFYPTGCRFVPDPYVSLTIPYDQDGEAEIEENGYRVRSTMKDGTLILRGFVNDECVHYGEFGVSGSPYVIDSRYWQNKGMLFK